MRVASLRLRLLAGLVDAAVVIGAMAGLVGLGIAGAVAYARVRGDEDEQEGDEQDEPSDIHCTTRDFRQSPELRAALSGASAGFAVASRNWRGPGFRVVGLRRVDAQTGGIVSVRSALIGVLFDQAWQAATRPLFGSGAQRQRDRISALGPQLTAVKRKYADDPQARQRAMMELYKTNDVNPVAGCGRQLAGPVVSQLVLALGSRGGRTVRDRITGTGVIVDR
jgi:60Kd inner membrane protein